MSRQLKQLRKPEAKTEPVEPLRLLREVAGSTEKLLPQAELAQHSDISLDTIRAIENNRRSLTAALFQKLKHSIGAEWDPKRQLWHVVGRPDEPYSEEWFRKFRTKWFKHPHQPEIEAHVLCRRLLELLVQVEDSDYNRLFYRLFDFLDETREALHITGARRVFDKTRFQLDFGRGIKTKEVELIVRQFKEIDKEIISSTKEGSLSIAQCLDFRFLTRPEHPQEPPKHA